MTVCESRVRIWNNPAIARQRWISETETPGLADAYVPDERGGGAGFALVVRVWNRPIRAAATGATKHTTAATSCTALNAQTFISGDPHEH